MQQLWFLVYAACTTRWWVLIGSIHIFNNSMTLTQLKILQRASRHQNANPMFTKRLWCVNYISKLSATSNYVKRLRRARRASQEAQKRNPYFGSALMHRKREVIVRTPSARHYRILACFLKRMQIESKTQHCCCNHDPLHLGSIKLRHTFN